MNACCAHPRSMFLMGLMAVAAAGTVGFFAGRGGEIAPAGAPLVIDATGSAIGEEFSLATGPVSTESEAVFVLDHASGLLQCNVLYPRAGRFGAAFQTNVKEALQSGGKNAKYLMVTGTAHFPGATNRGGMGGCVVYVLDQNTGAYACYGVPFNSAMVNNGAPQMGALMPIATGMARQALDREALR